MPIRSDSCESVMLFTYDIYCASWNICLSHACIRVYLVDWGHEFGRIWKKAVAAYIKVLHSHLSGGSERNH